MEGKSEFICNMKKNCNVIIHILETVLIILSIIYTRTIFAYLSNIDLHINLIICLIMLLLIILNMINRNFEKQKIKRFCKYLLAYYVYISIFAVFSYIKDKSFFANFYIILPGFFSLIVFNKEENKYKELLKKFVLISVVLAGISIIFYLLGTLTNVIKSTGNIQFDWGIKRNVPTYFFLHFNTQYIGTFNLTMYRNTGIFTEAPMFSLILTVALIINMFIINANKKNNIILSAIIAIAIITTFSATGLVILTISLIVKLFLGLKNKNKIIKIFILVFLSILVIISASMVVARSKMSTGSIRIDDYKACIMAWKNYPLMGNGYNNENAIKKYMGKNRIDMGLSNSLGVILAEGGIYLLTFYVFPIIALLVNYVKSKNYENITFYSIILLLTIMCIFPYTPLMLLIISGAYSVIIKEKMFINGVRKGETHE